MNYFVKLLMTHISIKKKPTKNISFFYLCSTKRYEEKTRNAFKIELVLKMLSNEEERYLKKKYGQILHNLPHLVVQISYIKL